MTDITDLPSLYTVTGDIKDLNTLLISRAEAVRLNAPVTDGDARDAERYRWLKERATVSHVLQATPTGFHYPTTWHIVTGGSDTDIDAAIDAALAQETKA